MVVVAARATSPRPAARTRRASTRRCASRARPPRRGAGGSAGAADAGARHRPRLQADRRRGQRPVGHDRVAAARAAAQRSHAARPSSGSPRSSREEEAERGRRRPAAEHGRLRRARRPRLPSPRRGGWLPWSACRSRPTTSGCTTVTRRPQHARRRGIDALERRRCIDKVAAAVMLQAWLDAPARDRERPVDETRIGRRSSSRSGERRRAVGADPTGRAWRRPVGRRSATCPRSSRCARQTRDRQVGRLRSALVLVAVLVIVAGYVGWWYIGKINPTATRRRRSASPSTETDTLDTLSDAAAATRASSSTPSVFRWYVERKGGLELTPGLLRAPARRPHGQRAGACCARRPAQTYQQVTFPEGFTHRADGRAARPSDRRRLTPSGVHRRRRRPAVAPARAPPAGRHIARGPAVPRHVPGVERRNDGAGGRADGRADGARRPTRRTSKTGPRQLGRTPYQVLIIASMIEREAKIDEDRAQDRPGHLQPPRTSACRSQIDATLFYGQDPDAHRSPTLRQIDTARTTPTSTGSAADADRQPRPGVDRGRAQPGAEPAAGRPDLPRCCPTRRRRASTCTTCSPTRTAATRSRSTLEQHQANVDAARPAGLLG